MTGAVAVGSVIDLDNPVNGWREQGTANCSLFHVCDQGFKLMAFNVVVVVEKNAQGYKTDIIGITSRNVVTC